MAEKITVDLNQFRDWYNEDPESRDILFQTWGYPNHKVTVMKQGANGSQRVTSVSEIDLDGNTKKAEIEQLRKLLLKYPGEAKQNPAGTGQKGSNDILSQE